MSSCPKKGGKRLHLKTGMTDDICRALRCQRLQAKRLSRSYGGYVADTPANGKAQQRLRFQA